MISYVAEVRMNDVNEAQADKIAGILRDALYARGYDPERVELIVRNSEARFVWPPREADANRPSNSQLNYVRSLFKELGPLCEAAETDMERRASVLRTLIADALNLKNVSKRDMSPIIDCLKAAIADLRFEKAGLHALEE